MINTALLKSVFPELDTSIDFTCDALGDLSTKSENGVFAYIAGEKYLNALRSNQDVRAIFCTQSLASEIPDGIVKLIVDDPVWYFATLRNHLALAKQYEPTRIAVSAVVATTAVIAERGVTIGENVRIYDGVVIYSGVEIGDNAVILPGAVLGSEGFEHKKTSKGIVSTIHDGRVVIGQRAEIGANNAIAKGFSYRDTIIGADTKTDSLVYIAHGVQCGERCLIASNVSINGHVNMGDDVWVGPTATISNRLTVGSRVFVALGAVVVRNVAEGERVAGNFALRYAMFKEDWIAKGGQ